MINLYKLYKFKLNNCNETQKTESILIIKKIFILKYLYCIMYS